MSNNTCSKWVNLIQMLKSYIDPNSLLSPSKQWSKIIDIVSIANKIHNSIELIGYDGNDIEQVDNNIDVDNYIIIDENYFRDYLKEILYNLLQDGNIIKIWIDIFSIYTNISSTKSINELQQIINGYKIIANYFEDQTSTLYNGIFMQYQYIQKFITALFLIILSSYSNNDYDFNVIKNISIPIISIDEICIIKSLVSFESLSRDTHIIILDLLCSYSNTNSHYIISILSPDWSLQASNVLINDPRNNSKVSSSISNSTITTIFKYLLIKSLELCEPINLIDIYLLKRPYNIKVVEIILDILPDSAVIDIIELVALLWGDKKFVSKGNEIMQDYLTSALLLSLSKIKNIGDSGVTTLDKIPINLNNKHKHGIPLSIILSNGVSVYLDIFNESSRKRGMLVAELFSKIMGNPIIFDDAEFNKDQNNSNKVINKDSNKDINKDNNKDKEVVYDSDDSSGSELEGYDLGDERLEKKKLTPYLRVCLDLLQLPESKTDAADKHELALLSIPNIIQSNPVDAGDMCGLLVIELLRLSNSFNINNFDRLRQDALHSILVSYPNIAVPIYMKSIEDTQSMNIGAKVNAIGDLIKASYSLAKLPIPGSSDESNSMTLSSSILATLVPPPPSKTKNNNTNSKTIIKRPKKLELSKKKITTIKNNFTSVSKLFFYPILQYLVSLSKKLTSSSSSTNTSISSLSPNLAGFGLDSSSDSDCNPFITEGGSIPTFVNNFIINEIGKDNIKGYDKNTSITVEKEDLDLEGIDCLLPSQLLLALGSFTRCSTNSILQRSYTYETMLVANTYKDSTNQSLRQAALLAIHAAIESWSFIHSQASVPGSYKQIGGSDSVLSVLLDVTGVISNNTNSTTLLQQDNMMDSLILKYIDWAISSLPLEVDMHCKAIKISSSRIACDIFAQKQGHI